MSLHVFNTLSGNKDTFAPLKEGEARIYVCGVTVYDSSHIGHARSLLTFDVAYRYLVFLGYRVFFVRNFTDVDDKIIQRARDENSTAEAVAGKYIQAFQEDSRARTQDRPGGPGRKSRPQRGPGENISRNPRATAARWVFCRRRTSRRRPSISPRSSRCSAVWKKRAPPIASPD